MTRSVFSLFLSPLDRIYFPSYSMVYLNTIKYFFILTQRQLTQHFLQAPRARDNILLHSLLFCFTSSQLCTCVTKSHVIIYCFLHSFDRSGEVSYVQLLYQLLKKKNHVLTSRCCRFKIASHEGRRIHQMSS